MNCDDEKARCKRKTGNEKGPIEDRTAFDEVLKEFALFVGAVNLQLDEDLNRPDGKKHGIVGGRSADGPDTAITQAIAALMQLTPALQTQIRSFIRKVNRSTAQKPLVIVEDDLSEDAAKWLASHPGSAESLMKAGTIGPFKIMQQFTLGQQNAFHAHQGLHVTTTRFYLRRLHTTRHADGAIRGWSGSCGC